MDQNPNEPTLEESIKEVMQTLPPPIRQYLAQGKYTFVAKNLMAKYGLRIDQGGVLERELMLLLMGIEKPDEFAESLKNEAAIPEDTVRVIMTDINQEIFIPLQKEMRSAGSAAPETRPVQAPTPAPASAPATQSYTPPSAPRNPVSPDTAPLPPKIEMPRSDAVPADVPALRHASTVSEEQRARISNIAPRPDAPLPANLPGALPPRAVPEARPSFGATMTELSAQPLSPQPAAPARPYSVDPYREPIDEPAAE